MIEYVVSGSAGFAGSDFVEKFTASCYDEALGYQPQRCHSYEVSKRKAKTTEYTCGWQVHHITPQRKAWMTRGKVYSCVKCGNVIKELV